MKNEYSFLDDMSNEELVKFLEGLKELIDEEKKTIDPIIYKKYPRYVELKTMLKVAKERENFLRYVNPDAKADYYLGIIDWPYRGSREEIEEIEATIKKIEEELKEINFPVSQLNKYETFYRFVKIYTYGTSLLDARLNKNGNQNDKNIR